MTSASNKSTTESSSIHMTETLAQAFQELAKGEETAGLLEQNLARIEDKLDAILAAMETRLQQQEQNQEQNHDEEQEQEQGGKGE